MVFLRLNNGLVIVTIQMRMLQKDRRRGSKFLFGIEFALNNKMDSLSDFYFWVLFPVLVLSWGNGEMEAI